MNIKILNLVFLLVILGMMGCHNQNSQKANASFLKESDKKKSPGKIEFTEEIHNFGTLKDRENVSFSFRYKNTGGLPLRITKVEPSCGCLTVRYDKNEIASQTESTIEVIFHTEGEWGNLIKSVSVETSTGETRTLTIGAYVENAIFNNDINSLK